MFLALFLVSSFRTIFCDNFSKTFTVAKRLFEQGRKERSRESRPERVTLASQETGMHKI
jgi:hypothetical protein